MSTEIYFFKTQFLEYELQEYRATKSCRRAEACLGKIVKNLRKMCTYERKIEEKKQAFKKFNLHNLTIYV